MNAPNRLVAATLLLLTMAVPAFCQESVVAQAKADLAAAGVRVENIACSDFEIAKVVAGRLASQGAGLLQKDCCGDQLDPNRSHCLYNGAWYAHDIVTFANGTEVDIAQDGGGKNGPTWQGPNPSDLSRYRSAVSLGLTGLVGNQIPIPPQPPPAPVPVPVPVPSVDYSTLLARIIDLQQTQVLKIDETLLVVRDTNAKVANMDRTVTQTLGAFGKFAGKYLAPAVATWYVTKTMTKPDTPAVAPAK